MGDANTPYISWEINDETKLLQVVNENEMPPAEKRFYHICVTNGLFQHNHIRNSRGHTLDWILSNENISNVHHVEPHMSLDNDSAHHKALSFTIIHNNAPEKLPTATKIFDYSTTKLNHTKWDLTNYQFPEITTADGAYYYTHDESKIIQKIQNFTETITTIQNKYTKLRKPIKKSFDQGHPWTKDRRYITLVNKRKIAKRVCQQQPNSENKKALRLAHIACFAL